MKNRIEILKRVLIFLGLMDLLKSKLLKDELENRIIRQQTVKIG
jgi:hypothetical protein